MPKRLPAFLKETLQLPYRITEKQLLIHMDSKNDAKENLKILIEEGVWFIVKLVKRKLRR